MKKSFFTAIILALLLFASADAPALASTAVGELEIRAHEDLGAELGRNADQSIRVRTVHVDCDAGKTITRALKKRGEKLLIRIRGRCEEFVVVERDDVAIVGVEPGTIVSGSITILGSTRVELRGFTVADTPGVDTAGIGVLNGSAARIQDMVVRDTASRGIRVRNAAAEIIDTTVTNVGDVGILVRASVVTLEGDVACNDNGLAGFSITLGSSVFSKSGNLSASGNETGMLVQTSSSFANPEGTLAFNGNLVAGIRVLSLGVFIYGASLEADNNDFFGMFVDENSSFSPFSEFQPPTSFSNNGFAGIFAERGSTVELAGDGEGSTTLTGNPFGIFLDESSFRIGGATIVGNFLSDVQVTFGSRASFEGLPSTVGSVGCDDTILIRGAECTQ